MIALNVRDTTVLSPFESRAGEMAASVARNPNMVAMFGSIIPEPFAQPRMRTCFPPMRHFAAAHFGRVSVVMIACVNCSKAAAPELRLCASCGIARRIFSTRSGRPITPVEHTSISSGLQRSERASSTAVLREAAIPCGPVQQLSLIHI